jgi:hypothetical protein
MKERGLAPVKVEARPSRQPTMALRQVVSAMAAAQQNAQRRAAARANTHHLGDQAIKSTPKQRPTNSNGGAFPLPDRSSRKPSTTLAKY